MLESPLGCVDPCTAWERVVVNVGRVPRGKATVGDINQRAVVQQVAVHVEATCITYHHESDVDGCDDSKRT
jgi:hypothetical protein